MSTRRKTLQHGAIVAGLLAGANEGMLVVAVPSGTADRALTAWQCLPQHQSARRIGAIRARTFSPVVIQRGLGGEQALDEPIGAALPRIC